MVLHQHVFLDFIKSLLFSQNVLRLFYSWEIADILYYYILIINNFSYISIKSNYFIFMMFKPISLQVNVICISVFSFSYFQIWSGDLILHFLSISQFLWEMSRNYSAKKFMTKVHKSFKKWERIFVIIISQATFF